MIQKIKEQEVIPFFRLQGEELSLRPDNLTPAEEIFLEKEKLMMAILDSINDGVFTVDFNMRITSFNRAAERITGYAANEAIGKLCIEVFCDTTLTQEECLAECPMIKTVRYGTPITRKREFNNKRGEIVTIASTTNVLLDLQNQPIGGVATFVDITALEELKEKLQDKKHGMGDIVGKSRRMTKVYHLIEAISDTLANVLIQGETGTGKGLIARAVHFRSAKYRGPFVQVNCAAIPETLLESELFGHVKGAFTGAISDRQGRFEQAHKGTLFLDEIGELSPAMQAKLLRVVEEKRLERVGGSRTIEVDVRIVSATNKDLRKAVQDGEFREDLYFRLNTIPIILAPLRKRVEDIPLLLEHFIEKFNYKMDKRIRGAAPEVFDVFLRHTWPGNVRELESALEYAFTICRGDYLEVEHLPPSLRAPEEQGGCVACAMPAPPEAIESPSHKIISEKTTDRERLHSTLKEFRWNRAKAAQHLNMSRTTLWRLMREFQLIKPRNLPEKSA